MTLRDATGRTAKDIAESEGISLSMARARIRQPDRVAAEPPVPPEHPTRRAVREALEGDPDCPYTVLAAHLGITHQAVSLHARALGYQRPKTIATDPAEHAVKVRIPARVLTALDRVAYRSDRSRRAEAVDAVTSYLESHPGKLPAAEPAHEGAWTKLVLTPDLLATLTERAGTEQGARAAQVYAAILARVARRQGK